MRTKEEIQHHLGQIKELAALLRQSAEKAGEDLSDYYLCETAGRLEALWVIRAQRRALEWVLEKAGSQTRKHPRAGALLKKLLG